MGRALRILAIELTSRGFAFAVLEGSERLIDWGGRRVRGDASAFLPKLGALLERYRVDAVVLEEPAGSRRDRRGREWLAWAEEYAAEHGLRRCALTNPELQRHFAAAGRSRYQIASAVARLFPELARDLPRSRAWWHTEPLAIGAFIATARGWAVLRDSERRIDAGN